MKIEEFMNKMTCIFPNINNDMDKHLIEYGECLDTIVIEEVIMPEVINLLKKDTDTNKLMEIFDYFEDVSINSDEYLKNVFSITTLEILGNDRDILNTAKKYMGPVTIRLQREADINLGRQV